MQKAKRLITVRFEPTVRSKLDEIASTSDRTLAQLVRYALTSYFETERVCASTVSINDGENGSRHTALRISEDLAIKVETLAAKCNVTVSDVIRDAVNVWLSTDSMDSLGSPALVEAGEK